MGKGSAKHRSGGKKKVAGRVSKSPAVAKGRKRAQVIREPNGQKSRTGTQNLKSVVLAQPHRAWRKDDERGDQRLESLIGHLLLRKIISRSQYEAAEKWRRLMHEFHVILACPRLPNGPLARISARDPGEGNLVETGASVSIETEEERRDRVLRTLGDIGTELRAFGRPKQTLSSLEAIILYDRTLHDYGDFIRGLNALVRYWKIPEENEEDDIDTAIKVM